MEAPFSGRGISTLQKLRRVLAGTVAVGALATSAQAQSPSAAGGIDDGAIVVTAQRRQELSRDVPITVTSVDAGDLKAANVETLLDLPRLAPGVRFDQQGAYTQPVIRGIGNTISLTSAGNSVGIYVNGFYVPNTLVLDFDFLNVENIQVLKGPQGTLFGRNATAGAILITTAEPAFETAGIVEASYERFDAKKIQGYFTMPISEKVAFSIEGTYGRGDGYHRHIYDGSLATGAGLDPNVRTRHPGAYEKWAVRTAFKAELTDTATILLRYEHADKHDPLAEMNSTYLGTIDGVPYPFSAGDSIPGTQFAFGRRQIAHNLQSDFRVRTDVVQLTGLFDLGAADLTSYSQYRSERIRHIFDSDYSAAQILGLSLPEKAEVWTQELLLNSKPGGRLQYTAGLFFYAGESDTGIFFVDPGPSLVDFSANGAKLRTYAAFADVTYEVMEDLFLTGGLRYSHDVVKDAYAQIPFLPGEHTFAPDFKDDKLSPRVVVRYKPTVETSVYASFTKGYKSAVPDPNGTVDDTYQDGFYLRPEEMDAFEAGFKYATAALSFELAGFWYDYKNLQNSFYETGTAIYSNAARSRIRGIEAALRYEVAPGFQISAAGTYLDAKYREYERAGFFAPVLIPDNDGDGIPEFAGFDTSTQFDASGLQVQRAPKFSGTFSASYATEVAGGELLLSGNLYHTSKVYFDAAHQFPQKAYDIVSARVQWTDPSDRITVAVYGDNLLDEKYRVQAYGTLSAAASVWGKPVSYGVSLRYNFGGS